MSNRILAFLVLFGVFATFFLIYIYFFVYYTATITVRSNVPGYSVELFGKSIAQTFTHDCPEEDCTIKDISPLEYNMTIKKEGYIDFFQNVDIGPSSKQEIIITLEKEVVLQRVEQEVELTVLEPEEETPSTDAQERIAQLRKEKSYLQIFSLSQGDEIGFKEQELFLDAFHIRGDAETMIQSFDKTSRNIILQEILDTPYVYLQIGKNQYLYDSEARNISEISLVPEIQYIKKGRVSTELVFITDKGAFIYHIGSKEFSYFYFFRDFVYVDEGYIGVIYNDEEQKRINYSLEDEKKHVIIKYDPNTQSRDVLYRTELDIEKITKKGEEVYFEADEEEYKLENY